MKTYTYSEARQRLATLLDQARREGRVQIRRQDGSTFILQPVASSRSPLDVPGVQSTLRSGELVRLIRTERGRAGNRITERFAQSHLGTTARSKQPRLKSQRPKD
jgi:hypothetical protein